MIALIRGELIYKSFEHVIIDVGGVGYRVVIPLSTFYSVPEHGEVRLHIYTHVREDAIQLFGFLTPDEKNLFILLLSVSGVGPKLALNILSHAGPAALRDAITRGDAKRLSALPGIGKKTAERLVLELNDKIRKLDPVSGPAPVSPHPPALSASGMLDDALSALINLGYKEAQARKALDSLEISPATQLEEVLKGALKILLR